MRHFLIPATAMLLAACGSTVSNDTSLPPAATVEIDMQASTMGGPLAQLAIRGPAAAEQLKAWYDDTAEDCGGADKPSYLCSGVLVRGTYASLAYYAWDPSPRAIDLGGISFSWLRRDQTFSRLLLHNGLIFFPNAAIPPDKNRAITTLCAYPVDGYTHVRASQGCGARPGFEAETDTCQNLGIHTAQAWIAKYANVSYNVCGWSMRTTPWVSAAAFNATLQAHQGLPDTPHGWQIYNELVMATWQTGTGATLPIHSFFYVGADFVGRAKAQSDQSRYYQQFGQVIPIIRLDLPTAKPGSATFGYAQADQVAGVTFPILEADFEEMPVGHYTEFESRGTPFRLNGDSAGIRDQPLPSQDFTGRYAETGESLVFAVKGVGARTVSFSWGCDEFCIVQEYISGNQTILTPMKSANDRYYGRATLTVTAPDILEIVTGSSSNRIVLDNLKVE